MNHSLASGALLVLLATACASSPPPEPAMPDDKAPAHPLAWLAGSWCHDGDDGSRIEELWSVPRGGTMIGAGRTIGGGDTVFFEFLRIVFAGDGGTYFASPDGRAPATPFAIVAADASGLRVENPDHDFPQVIAYRRQDDGTVEVAIATLDGAKAHAWVMRRCE